MPIPVFTQVIYLSPWFPLPPGGSKLGVDASVSPPSAQGQVLAGRLRQGDTTLQVVVGVSATEVVIVPTAPLSTMAAYFVDVQWVPQGTAPGSVVWTTPDTVATSPVVTSLVTPVLASIAGSAVSLQWDFGAAALTPAGANLSAYNSNGRSVGFSRVQGLSGTMTLSASATPGAQLYLQAVMPVSGTPGAGFNAPFTMGPIVAGAPLPLQSPTITAVQYDGTNVQVAWTAPAAPATGGAIGYDLVVTNGGASAATTVIEAGVNGGVAILGAAGAGGWSVAGRVRVGSVIGAPGSPLALLTQPPTLDQITVSPSGAGITARATFPAGAPTGATALVELLDNGVVMGSATVSSSGGTATVAASGVSGAGWQVRARMQLTSGGTSLTGPNSPPAAVLAIAPGFAGVTMISNPAGSGWLVTVTAAAPPAPGTTLQLTISQGGITVATQTISAGASASIALAQGTAGPGKIDGSTVATAALSIASPTAVSPAAQATFVGTAPVVTAVQYIGPGDPTGQPLGLQVDAASGGQTGQVLSLRLSAGDQVVATSVGATATHANLPLAQELDPSLSWWIQARWTGAGVTTDTYGGWSAPVAVLTATTALLDAEYDAGQLTVAFQTPSGVAPAQGLYAYAMKTSGGPITGAAFLGTSGSFSLTAGTNAWNVAARPYQPLSSGGANRSLAPSSAGVPLLTTAPTPAAVDYDGATLSARWNVVTDAGGNPATSAVLEVAGGSGTVLTAEAGSASGVIAIPLSAADQGKATVRVRAVRSAAAGTLKGAYSVKVNPLVAAPTVGTVTLGADDEGRPTVDAVLTPPAGVPSGTTYRAWLLAGDETVSGPVDATTSGGTTSVRFSYGAAGVTGLSIVAQAQVSGTTVLQGPRSAPVPVLATPPVVTAVLVAPAATANNWQLDASWRPPADAPAIVSYTIDLTEVGGQSPVAQGTSGTAASATLTFATSAIDATKTYTLTVTAAAANGSTTPVGSAVVRFATAAFTAVTTSRTRIDAQWTAPSGTTGASYELRLLETSASPPTVLAGTQTSATCGGIDITSLGLQPSGSYALDLVILLGPTAFVAGSDGTAKSRPAPLLAQPVDLSIATDPVSGKATLSWTAIDGADYTVTFSDGTPAAATSKASYAFPTALGANADLRVSVTANIVSSAVVSTGPASQPLAVPTAAPALLWADYDGSQVSVAWEPVAGAVGYVASVIAAGATTATAQSAQVTGTSVAFAAALDPSAGPFAVSVQVVTKTGAGLPSSALPVFHTAWFVSTAQPDTQPPNIYPAATLARSAAKISIYLPPLASTTITVAPVGAFDLSANTDPTTKGALPYILTFAADSEAWVFDDGTNPLPPIRTQLQSDYVTFLQNAETAGASAWGVSILQQAIARWMPQTFEESHYYAYGLNLSNGPGTGSIDLRQGLVLRVSFADYTNVWSGNADSWLNGFAGGAAIDFDVADGLSGAGNWQLTLDAFVARLVASGAMSVQPPSTIVAASRSAGVADAADLFFAGFPQPFYRLFFPGQLEDPTSTGTVTPAANFALASASSYTSLGATSRTPSNAAPVAYFRGRTVVRVMIRISVNDVEVVVPLGTTVGNILDRYGVRPPAAPLQLTGVRLERAGGPGIAVLGDSAPPPPLVYDGATHPRVRLDWSTLATYGGPVDATNLPLLHGDRITF